jgi:hypothetical protein
VAKPDRLTYRTGALMKEHLLDDFGVTFELRRRRARVMAEYRLSGDFCATDLSLIEAVLYGVHLSTLARRYGVSRQATWRDCND